MEEKFKVAGIGELLWDILPSGKQAGGAPFNFTFHAGQVGCESFVFSAVGRDDLGEEIVQKASNLGINIRYIQENGYPTGTVTVRLDEAGHPDYTIHENVAWDFIQWNEDMKKCAGILDAVCFGSLAQRNPESAGAIRSFLNSVRPECLKVYDINLRQHYFSKEIVSESLMLADILKLNDEELPVLGNYFDLSGDSPAQLKQLIRMFDLKYIAYTKGSKGSMVLTPDDCSTFEAPKVKVVDTVGAGDAFTAIFIAGVLNKKPLTEIHKKANEVAAFVCTQKGATPPIDSSFLFF